MLVHYIWLLDFRSENESNKIQNNRNVNSNVSTSAIKVIQFF